MQIEIIDPRNQSDLANCLAIRHKVFVEEQNVPEELEYDGKESSCLHFLGRDQRKPVVTLRVQLKEHVIKFERVATLKEARGKGFGKELMEYATSYMTNSFKDKMPLLAGQDSAYVFYEKLGWTKVGGEFMDANIPHSWFFLDPNNQFEKDQSGMPVALKSYLELAE